MRPLICTHCKWFEHDTSTCDTITDIEKLSVDPPTQENNPQQEQVINVNAPKIKTTVIAKQKGKQQTWQKKQTKKADMVNNVTSNSLTSAAENIELDNSTISIDQPIISTSADLNTSEQFQPISSNILLDQLTPINANHFKTNRESVVKLSCIYNSKQIHD